MKWSAWLLCSALAASLAVAQQKPISQMYRRDVVEARTIAVVAYDTSSVQDSQENQRARLEVQTALTNWGRYRVVAANGNPDLILLVRKGHAQAATIGGATTPPVLVDPTGSGTNIGIHRGQNQPLSQPLPSGAASQPRLGSEVGSPDDMVELYRGGTPLPGDGSRNATQYPLDEPPIWSYTAVDGLKSPRLEAVAAFKKAVDAADKKK
jgi:hypothetical protein